MWNMYERWKFGIQLNDKYAIPTVKHIGGSVMFCILMERESIGDYVQSKEIMTKE